MKGLTVGVVMEGRDFMESAIDNATMETTGRKEKLYMVDKEVIREK